MQTERPAFALKKEAKTLSEPTGKLNTAHISIKNMINEQKEKARVSPTDQPRKPFDKDDLVRMWKTEAHQYKINGQEPLFHIMIKRDIQHITECNYFFEVDDSISKERLERALVDILAKLRDQLQNFDLEISVDVSTEQKEETKYLNGRDKFEKMARKNPNLTIFQNKFNLDIEF